MKCKKCGGRIVIEYLAQYGDIYLMKPNGKPYSKRVKTVKYSCSDYVPLIYCIDCNDYIECIDEILGEDGDEDV